MPYIDEDAAELLFRHKVILLLQGSGVLSEKRTELLLSWRRTGFSVHTRVRVEPEEQDAVERLARYILRPPISLERMRWDGVGEVYYRRKKGHDDAFRRPDRQAKETFDPAALQSPKAAVVAEIGAGTVAGAATVSVADSASDTDSGTDADAAMPLRTSSNFGSDWQLLART